MQATLPETEHFRIEHHPGNAGTQWKEYSIQPKREKTGKSRAMVPNLPSADSAELLVKSLHEIEAWYVENRKTVEAGRAA